MRNGYEEGKFKEGIVMKANEAPEKLYIFNPEKREVWFSKTSDKQVEYTRTDAFIEKVMKYVTNHFLVPGMDNEIKDFINYMKGE